MSNDWIESGIVRKATKSEKILKWTKNNRETVVGSLVILLAAIILGSFFTLRYSQVNKAAWKELFMAKQQAKMGKLDLANKSIAKIETGFSNTTAAGYAFLLKGDILFATQKYKAAVTAYQKASDLAKPETIVPIALSNIGKTQEAKKNFNEAIVSYRSFLERYPEHFLAPEAHFSIATIYEMQNKKNEAKSAYEKIALLYPQTLWAENAKTKLGIDKKKG
ncbi:MAG: tetratricopeptide repeat protein [Elusimicrobiales bacterium]|nr:tetratricopeptide repeat protein [Elusimicrobiales bacterium]